MAKKKQKTVTKTIEKPDSVQKVVVEKKENPYAHTRIHKK